ncbi:SLC13 family permease [Micromonospora sp. NPDC049679]|uniref:GntT/GntP/DsdX family permease n=1 Tax=Micromonospora sp. NPDC049679 TaxID=3155920 RepID=UPI0034040E8F
MMQLAAEASTSNTVLVVAALLGIATVVLLITWLKVHPFLALILGSAVLGLVAGLGAAKTVDSFAKGVGSTVGSVGLLIALGAMIGGLLADSGGADEIVETIVGRTSSRALPWAMAGAAALIGIPLFFEVGVVLLVPIVLLVATRTDVPLLRLGIPALAGLSVLHGFVPPHPGPLVAISALNADLGLTLALGLLLAIPTVIIAGSVFGSFISRYVSARPPILVARGEVVELGAAQAEDDLGNPNSVATPASRRDAGRGGGPGVAGGGDVPTGDRRRRPGFAPTVLTVLLPVILMLARAVGELLLDKGNNVRDVLDVLGNPVVALLIGTIVAMLTLGAASGMSRGRVSDAVGGALPPISGIVLIVAAGGGFKQTLVDAGVGNVIADAAEGAHLSTLVLGWLVAVGIRLATGSATVATITAAGIVTPLAAALDRPQVALLVLAIGAGSVFFSHVNDAGFWLVKEYFGMTVGETIKSWSVMETIISVVGLIGVLLLNLLL